MALIARVDNTSAVDLPEPVAAPEAPPVPADADQTTETADFSSASTKRLERDIEANYMRGQLDKGQAHAGGVILHDNKVKPDHGKVSETASGVSKAAPVRVADAADELNTDVRAAAGHMVGQPVVGRGECFDLVDSVLRASGARSAGDFDKITGKRDQDYKWGTPIDVKDVKPGDVLQFRDQKNTIEIKTKTTRTFPDGTKTTEYGGKSEEHDRAPQHSSMVLSNDGDGKMQVAEQHVKDPNNPGKLSRTVRENTVYTKDTVEKHKTVRYENSPKGEIKIEEEITVTVTVTGKTMAYRPQPKR